MWYFIENNQPTGPISREELLALIQAGRIGSSTPVWRKGMDGWRPLAQTDFQTDADASSVLPENASSSENAMQTEANSSIPADFIAGFAAFRANELSKIQKSFYRMMVSLFLLIVTTIGFFAGIIAVAVMNETKNLPPEASATGVAIILGAAVILILVSIFFTVYYLCLLYHLWRIVPNSMAYTTPGCAIGFLFIPIFNIVWTVLMFYHLGKHYDELRRWKRLPGTDLATFAIFVCILGFLPYISMLNVILLPLLLYKLKRRAEELLAVLTPEDYWTGNFYCG